MAETYGPRNFKSEIKDKPIFRKEAFFFGNTGVTSCLLGRHDTPSPFFVLGLENCLPGLV
jgi:hypothetical protein